MGAAEHIAHNVVFYDNNIITFYNITGGRRNSVLTGRQQCDKAEKGQRPAKADTTRDSGHRQGSSGRRYYVYTITLHEIII